MNQIYLENIDLSKLNPVDGTKHKESTLFRDKTTVYKIFDDLYESERQCKQTKIELLANGKTLPITVMPRDVLVYGFLNNRFEGYTMDYIMKSQTLYKAFLNREDIQLLFQILNIISTSLEEIHQDPRNIVISDLHATNIIVDRNLNPYIVDIDSCKIDGIKNEVIPISLKYYLSNRNLYSSTDSVETTANTDRLCLLMTTLGLIFNTHLDRISIYEYDEKAEKIDILKNIRELILNIKNSSTIPTVPYFHELNKNSSHPKSKLLK